MRLNFTKLSVGRASLSALTLSLLGLLAVNETMRAQRTAAPAVAQVGPGSPLPVFVVNDSPPRLPEGFTPGSSWRFTTWTVPSTLTFTATVQRTAGGWALLRLSTDPTPHWYFVPQMPGAWDPQ